MGKSKGNANVEDRKKRLSKLLRENITRRKKKASGGDAGTTGSGDSSAISSQQGTGQEGR
ncbi:hypothetical protein [Anaplasma platys]|uniref:hypothetical protein n=1 Tax=Anaplasma platys TaxID=949 RepID=UPI00145C9252|nr:hypothetical protein [Anaplasma platys]